MSRSSTLLDLVRLTRWGDWMQSKLPFLAAMTVILAPSATALDVLAITATVASGAAFGYGLNEVADRASDARAERPNQAAGLDRRVWLPFLVLTAGIALGLSLVWAPDAAAPALVLLSLGLAVAYSAPPLRLKERGGVGLAGAAAAQWAVPVLVVAAAEPGGWLRPSAWLFAALSVAIGTRWMAAHQLRDAIADRRSGVRTYGSRRADLRALLFGAFAGELVLLGAGVASAWPHSVPAAIALAPYLAYEGVLLTRRRPLSVRLAGYEEAPLGMYYFFALPVALAIGTLVTASASPAIAALLLALAVPQLVARIRYWRGRAGSAMNRARASAQSPVVSASEPHP